MIQGRLTAQGSGMPNLPLAMIAGHPDVYSKADFKKAVETVTLDGVIKALTAKAEQVVAPAEPGSRDVVFEGSFEEVNEFFYENKWQEGIPIVPPTREKVNAFLRFTGRPPDEILGVLLPQKREATPWNIAVNGVMAGCRPEYMPVLIALVEVMADPRYGVEHSGNTPGAEELITINGPIIKDLKFNYEQGALRVGFRANTSIGRFWRLYLRNVAGFTPHETDKGTFGNTWRVVLAENEDALDKMGWKPTSFYQGFKQGENVVTVARYTGGGVVVGVHGSAAEEILPYLADSLVRQVGWELIFTTGSLVNRTFACTQMPHLILSPCIAEVFAKSGFSKQDVKVGLFELARLPARAVEQLAQWRDRKVNLPELVKAGVAPAIFHKSSDPDRMLPIVCSPDDILVTVSGDPLRSNCYVFAHNGVFGYTTSKKIELPVDWKQLLDRG